jgi:hypothetical protein
VLCSVCSILKKRAPFNWGGVVSYLGLVVDQLIVCTGYVIEISFFSLKLVLDFWLSSCR